MTIFRRGPPNSGKYLASASMTAGPLDYSTWSRETDDETPLISEFCLWQKGSTFYAEDKTTEPNLIARSDKSGAEVTNNKRLLSGIVLLKLLTDTKHRAVSLRKQSFLFSILIEDYDVLAYSWLQSKLSRDSPRQ